MTDFMRTKILPVSKSAPRDFCALIILSVSSNNVGIKRSAIVIIIANSKVYGGGGIYNYYMLTSDIDGYPQVMVHEFGHSFAGLGDEYFYENIDDISLAMYHKGVEPWEPNLTTLTDFESKWADLVPDGVDIPTTDASVKGVGVFEGGGYVTKDVYRPVYEDCRMKNNEAKHFCPVCERAIGRVVDLQYNK